MRVYLLDADDGDVGPMSLEELRDRLDLRMVDHDQPCRIAGLKGVYVAGEVVSGQLFRGWDPGEEGDADEDGLIVESLLTDGDRRNGRGIDIANDGGEEWDGEEGTGGRLEDAVDADEEWWHGHPGLTAWPVNLGLVVIAGMAAVAAAVLDWSGWLAAGFAALCFCSMAWLLGKCQGTRYSVRARRLEWQEAGWFSRPRELPRAAVEAIDVRYRFPGILIGRADLVVHHVAGTLPTPVVFRQIARARRVRALWR